MFRSMNDLVRCVALGAVVLVTSVPASARTIAEVAQQSGQFNTLLTAAKAAGLVPALTGRGPLTVFAPTDAAFAKLPPGTVKSLLRRENRGKLATILKYHVVSGAVRARDISPGRSRVATLAGQKLTLSKHGGVRVNNARVTSADVRASNGVVHVIDRVLIPH